MSPLLEAFPAPYQAELVLSPLPQSLSLSTIVYGASAHGNLGLPKSVAKDKACLPITCAQGTS